MTKKFRLFKGGRKRDIYEDAKWKKRPLNIEQHSGVDPIEQEEWYDDNLRSKTMEIVNQITTDPVERSIAELMLENYTEKDIAEMLKISTARVEWFMRKIDAWKRNRQGDE